MATPPILKQWDDFNPAAEANKKLRGVGEQLASVRTSVEALAKRPNGSGYLTQQIDALQKKLDAQAGIVHQALQQNAEALSALRQAIQSVPAPSEKKSGSVTFDVVERDAKDRVTRFKVVED